jgi:hypothetical protein
MIVRVCDGILRRNSRSEPEYGGVKEVAEKGMNSIEIPESVPQGLKPALSLSRSGTAEAVPFQNRVTKQLL